MEPLKNEDEVSFKKYWKSKSKDKLIEQMWEMLQYMEYQSFENTRLEAQVMLKNHDYLSRCRSVGGVTLPAGV